jgi:hypothetical protein
MNLTTTILAASLLMGLAVLGLLIGYLITGKTRLRKGCGMQPKDKDGPCTLCGTKKKCDKEKK